MQKGQPSQPGELTAESAAKPRRDGHSGQTEVTSVSSFPREHEVPPVAH